MTKELREIIQSDIHRYGNLSLFHKPLQMRYIITYRKASFYDKKTIQGFFYRIILRMLSEKSGIQIPTKTKIGNGFYIGHFGTIIINPEVIIGDNVNIATGVTIGKTNRGADQGAPVIGSRVWIGTNAVIVGNIVVGDDVLIAPGSYINTDIPSHCVVIGNPAQIHIKQHATEGYINNCEQ